MSYHSNTWHSITMPSTTRQVLDIHLWALPMVFKLPFSASLSVLVFSIVHSYLQNVQYEIQIICFEPESSCEEIHCDSYDHCPWCYFAVKVLIYKRSGRREGCRDVAEAKTEQTYLKLIISPLIHFPDDDDDDVLLEIYSMDTKLKYLELKTYRILLF